VKQAGQIALFRFPQTDLESGKLRPALVLARVPGEFDDWLICMISTQVRHFVAQFDDVIRADDSDFAESGLKQTSVIRPGRLAVVQGDILLGTVGAIAPERLQRIKTGLTAWIGQT